MTSCSIRRHGVVEPGSSAFQTSPLARRLHVASSLSRALSASCLLTSTASRCSFPKLKIRLFLKQDSQLKKNLNAIFESYSNKSLTTFISLVASWLTKSLMEQCPVLFWAYIYTSSLFSKAV